jgi:hypothetical protein
MIRRQERHALRVRLCGIRYRLEWDPFFCAENAYGRLRKFKGRRLPTNAKSLDDWFMEAFYFSHLVVN